MDPTKFAVAVLTRGYQNLQQYNTLIRRNISIANNLRSLIGIDILVFHEGNILEAHQEYISKFTPTLNLKFICIKEHAFKEEKRDVSFFEPTKAFGLNYRHMCSFWFADFWNFVADYDAILRIDEDCAIEFNIPELFYILSNKTAVYGAWTRDHDFVTHGLNKFTQQFIKDNCEIPASQQIINHRPSGPYTNVIGLNLKRLRENTLVQKYIEKVKQLDYIYVFRWGDLPLWGEVLYYLCNPTSYLKYDKIKYFHGSHNFHVGGDPNKLNLKKMTV
jgi:lipopolysaccharide biosynthesis glycosyltransferase